MAAYERTVTVGVDADSAFRFLSDPANLPRYVATMVQAEPAGSGRMHVAADVEGRHEESDARFHTDAASRRMEWSGREERGYRGWLEVHDGGRGEGSEGGRGAGATVTVHLDAQHDDEAAEIDRALDETAANVKQLLQA